MERISYASKAPRFISLTVILAFSCIVALQEYNPHLPLREKIQFDFNEGFYSVSPEALKALSFGYPFVLSSLLWLRFWHHTPPKKMGLHNQTSWIFLDLYTISVIDPEFLPTYTHGAMFVSVITEDRRGAEILLKRGVKQFPKNWRIRAYLAYHYQHELFDIPKAIEQYRILMQMDEVPKVLISIGASLIMRGGDFDTAEFFLRDMLRTTKSKKMRGLLEEKLEELQKRREEKERTQWIEQ